MTSEPRCNCSSCTRNRQFEYFRDWLPESERPKIERWYDRIFNELAALSAQQEMQAIARQEHQIPQEYLFGLAFKVWLVSDRPYPSQAKAEAVADRVERIYGYRPKVEAVRLSPEDLKKSIEQVSLDRQERAASGDFYV